MQIYYIIKSENRCWPERKESREMRYDAIYVRQSLYREESISLETQVQIAKNIAQMKLKFIRMQDTAGRIHKGRSSSS